MKSNKYFKKFLPFLEDEYGKDKLEQIIIFASNEYTKLCNENQGESKAIKKYTIGDIYPTIAIYRGILSLGVNIDDAVSFIDKTLCLNAQGKAKAMQKMCKLPGMYRMMPSIFKKVTLSQFSEKQGFKSTFYQTEKTRCKFDMTKCLYCDICKANNAMELVKCWCHTDDVTDGNIHPKLCWNRSKTMGEGGDVCDFDLFIVQDDTAKK